MKQNKSKSKRNIVYFLPYAESTPKNDVIVKRELFGEETVWGVRDMEKVMGKGSEFNQRTLYTYGKKGQLNLKKFKKGGQNDKKVIDGVN